MGKLIKYLFPFIESEDFMEDKSYILMFSAILFLITSFFSYQLIKLYSPELYVGVDQAFPIGILSISILLFLTTVYFVMFILIPFTLNAIVFISKIPIKLNNESKSRHSHNNKREISYTRSRFSGPLSQVMNC